MTFDYPWLLPLAVLLPAGIAWAMARADRNRERRFARFGDAPVIERLLPPGIRHGTRGRGWRLAVAAALAGVGLSGPRWGTEETIVRTRGLDMVIALDASLSMLATDDKPNRLTRMKQEVRRLRAMSGGDRVGLIAFAGRSYVLSPLTIDVGALDLFLDNLDPSVVGQAGSSLARAIRQGTDLLSLSRGGADKALIAMSDGEAFEPEEDVTAEAQRAAAAGVSVVMVGFGTEGGSRIPIQRGVCVDPTQRCTGAPDFKRDENGEVVITRYQPEFLRAAANAAGGTFIDAAASDKATRVRGALAALRRQQRLASAGETRIPRFQFVVLPALLLLLLDTWRAERGRRRRPAARPVPSRAPGATAAVAVAVLLVLAACAPKAGPAAAARAYRGQQYVRAAALYRAMVSDGDRSPATLYNFGTSLLAADSLRSAAEALERATEATDPELRYRALFNLGLAHLKRGLALPPQQADEPLNEALATYKKVLLLRSGDLDAKWNYELALRKQQQGGGGGGGGSDDQNPNPSPQSQSQAPSGGLGERQAEQLLGSAAREERDVQQRRQRQQRQEPPRGGKDW